MKFLKVLFVIAICFTACNSSSLNNQATKITVVNNDEIKSLLKKKEYSLVYYWTSWCGVCRKTINETLPQIEKSLNKNKAQLIIIAASKDDEKLQSIIDGSGLSSPAYRLDFFGPNIWIAQKPELKSSIEALFPNASIWKNSIPVFILVDENMNVINTKLPADFNELKELIPEILL